MDTLRLDVDHGTRIDDDPRRTPDRLGKALLVAALDTGERGAEFGIPGKSRQPLKIQRLSPVSTEFPVDQRTQRRVRLVEPESRRDAIGHVAEALGK